MTTICPECGEDVDILDFDIGTECACGCCNATFVSQTRDQALLTWQAKSTQESERLSKVDYVISLVNYLTESEGRHYVDLDPAWRNAIEEEINQLSELELSTWNTHNADLYKRVQEIPGRERFMELQHRSRVEALLLQANQTISNVAGSIGIEGSTTAAALSKISAGTSMSGLLAAKRLGEEMGEDLGDSFFED
tara:strand:- start:318 stop:899 length:582 start_codon:yes stop_codon:yes gene_type:complete